jgi:hypothetical protein
MIIENGDNLFVYLLSIIFTLGFLCYNFCIITLLLTVPEKLDTPSYFVIQK